MLVSTASIFLLTVPALADRVLRLDQSAPGEIDPAKGVDYSGTVLAVNLYDALTYPKQGGGGVSPLLAASWTIDGPTYTFKLRPGVKFHSGNPLTSADVVFSYNRLMTLGQGAASLFEGRVKSVEAVDPMTVKFTLNGPFAPFLAATSRLSVVDSKLVIANKQPGKYGDFGDYGEAYLSGHDAGSGAYEVTSQNPQSETDMTKFAGYFLPFVSNSPDKVRMRYSLDPSTVRQLIARGEHDIASPWLSPEVIKAMVKEGSVHLALEPGATGEYIKLNTARPPLDDVHCRLALTYAFDYATVDKLLEVEPNYSQGITMHGAIPSGLIGYDPNVPGYARDMDKAKAELAKCKYKPTDFPLDIAWIAEVPARERTALLMQAAFTQLGFTVNVTRAPWALVTNEVTQPKTAPHAIEIAVNALSPDPDSLLFNMYSSSVPPTWMSAEHLSDPAVDKLLNAGRSETDETKRAAIYGQLNSRLRDLAPDIFAYEFVSVYAIRNGVVMHDLEDPKLEYPISSFSLLFKDVSINSENANS
jgi:peptide/nickel transport system substrate-binding protein